jgi:hypothetical protein
VGNVVDAVAPHSVGRNRFAWFPYESKEARRTPDPPESSLTPEWLRHAGWRCKLVKELLTSNQYLAVCRARLIRAFDGSLNLVMPDGFPLHFLS